jgi:hypothetical protein
MAFTVLSQDSKVYEIILGLERSQKNVDEYGNFLPRGEEIVKDIMYIEERDLKYVIERSTYGKGLLWGDFNINDRIRVNNRIVNTTWSLVSNRYYIKVTDREDKENFYYIIPKVEITDKIKRRF